MADAVLTFYLKIAGILELCNRSNNAEDRTDDKGRNKIVKLSAIIDQVYPSMFVIKPMDMVDLDRKSYSYSDVLCGDVKFI